MEGKRLNDPDGCSGYCLGCDLDCTWAFNRVPVSPAPAQNAEELIDFYHDIKAMDSQDARIAIMRRDAAQRQAGREEREGELEAMHEAWCDDIKERYAALVEAAKKRIATSCVTCGWKHQCGGCAYAGIRKALRDLEGK